MNEKLLAFEEAINKALNEADGDLEIAEIIGVMQIKLYFMCRRLEVMGDDDGMDPADAWKRLKRD